MQKHNKPIGSYISFMSNKVKKHGGINLAQGIPGFEPPKALLTIAKEIMQQPIHQYAPGTGNFKLLDILTYMYQPFSINTSQFLITNGATEAGSLLFTYLHRILEKPFCTLAFSPVYETYRHLPSIFNLPFEEFFFNDNGSIDFDRLRYIIKIKQVKIVFVNSPGNPYGKIWQKDEIINLLKIAEELNFYVLFDSVYNELYFNEIPYSVLHHFSERVFYMNSFSKKFSITGWRLGYLIASEKHMPGIQAVHDYTGLCAPSVLQQAVADYLCNYNYGKEYIYQLRQNLTANFNIMTAVLTNKQFEIAEIDGGYFVWAKLPKQYNDGFDFAMWLYDTHNVAVIPGEHFSKKSKNYIRLNIAREKTEFEAAINVFKNL